MKAIVCHQKGLENLSIETIDIPEPTGEFDVVFQVLSCSLNPVDFKRCTWDEGGFLNLKYPCTPGLDACGVVHKLGKSVDPTRFIVGKTVILLHGFLGRPQGAFAEYYIHDSRFCSIVPESTLSKFKDLKEASIQLSAVPCAGYTAFQLVCVKLGLTISKQEKSATNLRRIISVLVTAGAGGVGTYCLQLLQLYREGIIDEKEKEAFKIITTCSSKNFDYVQQLGATHVIDYNTENIVARAKEITDGVGVGAWIDLVGKDSVNMGLEALSHGGHLCVAVENGDYNDKLFVQSLSVSNVSLGLGYVSGLVQRGEEIAKIGDIFIQLVADRIIINEIQVIQIDKIIEGLLRIQKSQVRGKLVCTF